MNFLLTYTINAAVFSSSSGLTLRGWFIFKDGNMSCHVSIVDCFTLPSWTWARWARRRLRPSPRSPSEPWPPTATWSSTSTSTNSPSSTSSWASSQMAPANLYSDPSHPRWGHFANKTQHLNIALALFAAILLCPLSFISSSLAYGDI